MAIIIDANRAHIFFSSPEDEDMRPIWEYIKSGRGKLVYGGLLTEELCKIGAAIRILVQLDRAGRTVRYPSGLVDAATAEVNQSGACVSNDTHIIGLAKVSGCRLVCTEDTALMIDFKNKVLLDSPRGKVYRRSTHARLLVFAPQARPPS